MKQIREIIFYKSYFDDFFEKLDKKTQKYRFAFQLDKYEKMEFERQFEISEFSTKADFIHDVLSKRTVKIIVHYKSYK